MTQRYFADTSALIARLLAKAAGYSWMESICNLRAGNTLAIAEVTEAEIASALNQLVRGSVIRQKRCEQSLALFWSQVDAGEYHVISVTTSIVRGAADSHAVNGADESMVSLVAGSAQVSIGADGVCAGLAGPG